MERPTLTEEQESLFEKINIALTNNPKRIPGTTTRPKKSTGYGRSVAFGFIRKRTYAPAPGRINKRWPELWDLIKQYGNTINMPWDGAQVNVNCVCGKHKDTHNVGNSYLISGGTYTGGELVIENELYDCNKKPIIFNGSEMEHWNKELEGFKWTIVFFTCEIPKRFKNMYPDNFRETYPNYKDDPVPPA
jgi:hypothetical protein